MRASTWSRLPQTRLCRVLSVMLALLISGAPGAIAAELVSQTGEIPELVAGPVHGAVYLAPGGSATIPVLVSATGNINNVPSSNPTLVRIPTAYAVGAGGSVSSTSPSGQLAFWRGSPGNAVTWTGAPTPYRVPVSVQVLPGAPMGTYKIPIPPTIGGNLGSGSNTLVDEAGDAITVVVGDGIAPTTVATPSGTIGNSGWYRSDVTVDLAATDNPGGTGVDRTEFSLDAGGTWTTGTSLRISDEGVKTVYFRSVDDAGNVEDPAGQLTVKIDKTARPWRSRT